MWEKTQVQCLPATVGNHSGLGLRDVECSQCLSRHINWARPFSQTRRSSMNTIIISDQFRRCRNIMQGPRSNSSKSTDNSIALTIDVHPSTIPRARIPSSSNFHLKSSPRVDTPGLFYHQSQKEASKHILPQSACQFNIEALNESAPTSQFGPLDACIRLSWHST